jgi:hypothetical protein
MRQSLTHHAGRVFVDSGEVSRRSDIHSITHIFFIMQKNIDLSRVMEWHT